MPILLFGLLIVILVEATLTSLPVTLLYLLILLILSKDTTMFLFAFLAGLLLDIATVRIIGTTSLFFTAFFLLAFLYDRKYEIRTVPFVLFFSFFAVYLYTKLFGYEHAILQAVFGMVLAGVLFKAVDYYQKIRNQHTKAYNL